MGPVSISHNKQTASVQILPLLRRLVANPVQQREEEFEEFAKDSDQRREILDALATAYDQRKQLRDARDDFGTQLKTVEESILSASLDLEQLRANAARWSKMDDQKLNDSLLEFLDSDANLELATDYVKKYTQWADVINDLTEPETGKNDQYKIAKRALNNLNMSADQVNAALVIKLESVKRNQAIEALKTGFPGRRDLIDTVLVAYEQHRPFQGRLDDPQDLQRMLKGAGILEFRILPTLDHPDVDTEQMAGYVELLKTKGPKYASDRKFIWCQVESFEEAQKMSQSTRAVVAPFGDKFYVLASNQQDETMLHGIEKKQWKLKSSRPTQDNMGRRAIAFSLDDRGGRLFGNITGKNIDRPLCIILDDMAISAPNISVKIRTHGIITGDFTSEDQGDMVNKLNAGSLPARLIEQPISVKTIGPSIGVVNRDKGIKAGFIGLIVVIVCMALYYTKAGAIADLALVLNILFVLAIMSFVRATFTLPGSTGLA